jgi:hypothetical protein
VEELRRLLGAIDRAGIPYMVTGSYASSFHGTPRASQDIDLVVAPTVDQLRELARSLSSSDYYVSEQSALDAFRRKGMFNIIDTSTGWKADLIIRKDRPFSLEEFRRRETTEIAGMQVTVATPEDVILAKLEWAKAGGSSRQIEDAAGILRARGSELDHDYLERWVPELNVQAQWEEASRVSKLA